MKECCEQGDINPKRRKRKKYFNALVYILVIGIVVAAIIQSILG